MEYWTLVMGSGRVGVGKICEMVGLFSGAWLRKYLGRGALERLGSDGDFAEAESDPF